jgi:3-hydroxybutyryl-CoA dehydrogenase
MTAKETVAAAGAGRMGRGIAIAFAYAGHPVHLVDLKARPAKDFAALADAANAEIRGTLAMLAGFGMLEPGDVAAVAGRISCVPVEDCAKALESAGVIFEGVPETIEAKRDAFRIVCAHARPDAIIASTTSTILSNALQDLVTPPDRFLNAHWLNPAFLVPLVEVSPGVRTDPAVTMRLNTLLDSIGKVPVVCKASPGYIVPRIQALAMNEAARLVEEGVASPEDIDKATKYGFGFRFAVLGLLEFIDWGGGDILYYASRYLASATGEERFSSPKVIETNMAEGRTGLRTREGFLDYSSMDVAAYQRERLGAFVAMLRHLDKMPVRGG